MKDPSQHKGFKGDFSSETIEVPSDHEWLVYCYSKNPWPVPDSDCVAILSFSEDAALGTAVEVPLRLIQSAFPGAPAEGIRKLVKMAKGM
jgi:hypothetical protein